MEVDLFSGVVGPVVGLGGVDSLLPVAPLSTWLPQIRRLCLYLVHC